MRHWRPYAFFMALVLALLWPVIYALEVKTARLVDLADWLLMMTAVAGLVAFSLRRKLLTRSFWRVSTPLVFVWYLYALFFLPAAHGLEDLDEPLAYGLDYILDMVVAAPMFVALYFYAYKDPFPWTETPPEDLDDEPIPPEELQADEGPLRAFVRRSPDWYIRRARKLIRARDSLKHIGATWNWAAFVFGPLWVLYRKMWLLGVLLMVFSPSVIYMNIAVGLLPESWDADGDIFFTIFFIERLIYGLFGTYLYVRHARSTVIALVKVYGDPVPDEVFAKKGGAGYKGPFLGAAIVIGVAVLPVALIVLMIALSEWIPI